MNQILIVPQKRKSFVLYKIQFILSILSVFCIVFSFLLYKIHFKKQEIASNQLLNNYNVYRLYSNSSINKKAKNDSSISNDLFGILSIPKINLYYPVFSELTEEKLNISLCKFHGDSLNDFSNICIAGHNYDNSTFFSNLSQLNVDDDILFYDNLGKQYIYSVFDKYEVNKNDLSPVLNYDKSFKQLTLVTCNNLNKNRLIIKAKQKSL